METNKVIAYSLLAQIRNSGNFINSSVEIFVPIVKYALYKHITQTGVYKGASIIEISTWINKYFGLEFPSVVLLDDFADLKVEIDANGKEKRPSVEDINILYVALTRAEKNLKLNDKTKEWLHDINKMSYLLNLNKTFTI